MVRVRAVTRTEVPTGLSELAKRSQPYQLRSLVARGLVLVSHVSSHVEEVGADHGGLLVDPALSRYVRLNSTLSGPGTLHRHYLYRVDDGPDDTFAIARWRSSWRWLVAAR